MKKTTQQRGQSMVEFALVFPLLALVLFAIIQYGFIFSAYISVKNASAVGARYAVTGSHTTADIESVTQDALRKSLSTGSATVNVTTNAILGSVSNAVSVQVNYTMTLIIPFVVPGKTNDNSLAISATTTML
jgi:Flp pilus assembly protein TadG